MRRRILFVATTPFAANAFLKEHILHLQEGHDVLLSLNLNSYPIADELKKNIRILNLEIKRDIDFIADLYSLVSLCKHIRREKPDVIHSITPKAGLLAMTAGFIMRVPFRHHTFTGQVWANYKGSKRSLFKLIDKLIILISTRSFTDSISQSKYLEKEKVSKPGQLSVLGPGSIAGVNITRFYPDSHQRDIERENLSIPKNACVFLFLGRINLDKGVVDLITAFKDISQITSDTYLLVVGPDEDNLVPKLKKCSEKILHRVRFIGATSEPEKFMQCSDIFTLPSYREGFGTAIIEAAACGIPAVAYRIEGVVDAVQNEETGILVPAGSTQDFKAAMLQLCKDAEQRKYLGNNAMNRSRTQFSSEKISSAWSNFYETL